MWLGVLWAIATVGWSMLRSDGLEQQSWDLHTVSALLWFAVALSVIGAATLTVIYRFSRAVYARHPLWILLWTPCTLAFAGLVKGVGAAGLIGISGFDLIYWGIQGAFPGNMTTPLGAALAHVAALATHLVLRRAYRASDAVAGSGAHGSWPSGKEWIPWLVALIPGLLIGLGYAQQDPLSRAVVKILWCGAASVLVFRLSRHT